MHLPNVIPRWTFFATALGWLGWRCPIGIRSRFYNVKWMTFSIAMVRFRENRLKMNISNWKWITFSIRTMDFAKFDWKLQFSVDFSIRRPIFIRNRVSDWKMAIFPISQTKFGINCNSGGPNLASKPVRKLVPQESGLENCQKRSIFLTGLEAKLTARIWWPIWVFWRVPPAENAGTPSENRSKFSF